ncbi:hypothetical protein DFH09DRAFT_1097998 [Mycena vulgaris]|nr:hypothetical protein DFH09DRAFT_1097998 [Mycena vulgaris]
MYRFIYLKSLLTPATLNGSDIPLGSKRRHGEEDEDEPTTKRAKKIETAAKEPTQKPKKTPKKTSGFGVVLWWAGTKLWENGTHGITSRCFSDARSCSHVVLEGLNGWAGAGCEHGRIFQTASIHSDVAAASTALVLKGLPLNAAMRAAVQT